MRIYIVSVFTLFVALSGCEQIDQTALDSLAASPTPESEEILTTETPVNTASGDTVSEPATAPDSIDSAVTPENPNNAPLISSLEASVGEVASPTPSETPEILPTATPLVSPSPEPSASPSATPSPSPSVSPSPSPSPSPTPYTYSGGTGTLANPYQLETATDVQNIELNASKYFTLVQDINMSGINFHPLSAFSGTLYGNNNHIYNLTITTTGTTKAALFASVSGTIVSLVLQNATMVAATYATGFAATLTGLISGCSVSGTITSPSGGNGFNTGTGNPTYVTKSGAGSVVNTTQAVTFNGNNVTYKFP